MTAEQADLGFAVQTTRGTAATAPTFRAAIATGRLLPAKTIEASPEVRRGRVSGPSAVGDTSVGGTVTFWARPAMLGLLLYAALGTKSVSGGSDPWTHTLSGPSATFNVFGETLGSLPFLTLWQGVGGMLWEQFEDCKLAALELSSNAGGPVSVVADLVGARSKSRTAAVGTAVIEAGSPFLHAHGQGALLVEGAAVSALDTWKLRIATGARLWESAGDVQSVVDDARVEITLTTGQIVTAPALWNRFHYGSATPADLAAMSTTITTLTGGVDFTFTLSATRSLRLVLPALEVTAVDGLAPAAGGGPLRLSASYRAYQPLGSTAAAVTATLRNGVSAY